MLPLAELGVFVDPLDATQEYSEGLWEFVTVSACVTRCGVPIVGLLYQPFQQRLYWTRPGTSANVAFSADDAVAAEKALAHAWGEANEELTSIGGAPPARMCCRQQQQQQQQQQRAKEWHAGGRANATDEGGLRLVLSRSHLGEATRESLAAVLPAGAKLTPVGGAGYKFIQVLEGEADAYLHPGKIRKWDVCAGEALLRAAGGDTLQWGGQPIDYCLPALPAATPPSRLDGQPVEDTAAAARLTARANAMASAVQVAGVIAAKSVELAGALRALLPAELGPSKPKAIADA